MPPVRLSSTVRLGRRRRRAHDLIAWADWFVCAHTVCPFVRLPPHPAVGVNDRLPKDRLP